MNAPAPAAMTWHQRETLQGIARTRSQSKAIWIGNETWTLQELTRLGFLTKTTIGPIAGGRYKLRYTLTDAGRAALASTDGERS